MDDVKVIHLPFPLPPTKQPPIQKYVSNPGLGVRHLMVMVKEQVNPLCECKTSACLWVCADGRSREREVEWPGGRKEQRWANYILFVWSFFLLIYSAEKKTCEQQLWLSGLNLCYYKYSLSSLKYFVHIYLLSWYIQYNVSSLVWLD